MRNLLGDNNAETFGTKYILVPSDTVTLRKRGISFMCHYVVSPKANVSVRGTEAGHEFHMVLLTFSDLESGVQLDPARFVM